MHKIEPYEMLISMCTKNVHSKTTGDITVLERCVASNTESKSPLKQF